MDLFTLLRRYKTILSLDTAQRLFGRATFMVQMSIEQIHLLWQQLTNGDESLDNALSEGVAVADLCQKWRDNHRPRFFLDKDLHSQIVSLLTSIAPKAANLIIAEADQICGHIFDLLGSGPTPLRDKIDWHIDFKTGHRWNPRTYYKRIRPAPYPGGYDIKVPWELSRCQHFVRLGQAYWITNDEKYAREFVAQVEDWNASNPWPWGVNWACTMDVAIRAVNWLWGYAFFRESPILSDEFRLHFYKSLLVHGRHIYRNLENRDGFTNNHYLADLVGLTYLGILCPEFKEAAEWRDFGLRELWQEMFKQVYPDGVSFEASIPYHRLAVEFFLSPVILCQLHEIPVPDEVMVRLEKMLEFVMHYTKPDGTAPLIGDGDNGRLHRLKAWEIQGREWNDHRHLLAIGATLFNRQDFAKAAGDQWEEAIWLLGERAFAAWSALVTHRQSPVILPSRIFPHGGLYILREHDACMIVDAGPNGQNGRGGHGHNDALSFEFYAGGVSWFIDPGTYAYTSDYKARELFRSTAYHNTPRVLCPEGLEQNRSSARTPFQLPQDTQCTASYAKMPTGAQRLRLGLVHYAGQAIEIERDILAHEKTWIIRDRQLSDNRCTIEVNFRLSHGVTIHTIQAQPDCYLLCSSAFYLLLCGFSHEDARWDICSGWISPSYGIRFESSVITYRTHKSNHAAQIALGWCFLPNPDASAIAGALRQARSMYELLVTTKP